MGCKPQGVRTAQEVTDAAQKTVDLLRSVQDASSAAAATPKIKASYENLTAALKAMVEYEAAHGEIRGRKDDIEELKADIARLQRELEAEAERIDGIADLPGEFWVVFRVQSVRMFITVAEISAKVTPIDPAALETLRRVLAIYERHGTKLVEFELVNATPSSAAAGIQRMREILGPNVEMIEMPFSDNSQLAAVGPVDDFDKLIAQIDFGTVSILDKGRGQFDVDLGGGVTSMGSDNALVGGAAVDDAAASTAEDGISFGEPAGDAEEHIAAMRAEADVHRRELEDAFRTPDPSDPDYLERMADLLLDPHAPRHRVALQALLNVDPDEVTDKDLRKRIARGYREAAFNSPFDQDAAIRGLVLWGGKFSVPLLIEILEGEKLGASSAVFDGLAEYPTPEGAAAVAGQISNFFSGEKAIECLRRMGPDAEEALIDVLPAEDPEVNYAAIGVLAEIGTSKSFAILKLAGRSQNLDIRRAAADATRLIKEREREGASR